MANVQTVAVAFDKQQELLLQIELAKVQRDIKELEIKLMEINHGHTQAITVHVGETAPTQKTTTNMSESIFKPQIFEEWLRHVRDNEKKIACQ
jgi:hypothetical protein